MSRIDCNYPYPILVPRGDDYINCDFSVDIESGLERKNGNLKIVLSYTLNCDGLNDMLINGDIDICVQIISRVTSYREIKRFNKNEKLTILIDANLISKEITFIPFIVALKDLNDFSLKEHNPIFQNMTFKIKKGEKIGFADSFNYTLPSVDPLKPTSSVIRIKLNDKKNAPPYEIELTTTKIYVLLNEKAYNLYNELRTNSDINGFLTPIIMIPTIVEALSCLKNEGSDGDYKQSTWGVVLLNVLDKKNIDLFNGDSSLVKIANDVFNDGFTFALTNMKNYFDTEAGVE